MAKGADFSLATGADFWMAIDTTWTSLTKPPPPAGVSCNGGSAAWVHDQTFIGSPGYCAGTTIGLYITQDGGNTWHQISIPQPAWSIFNPQQGYHTGANPVFPNASDGYAIAAAATCCGGGPAPYWALLASHDGGAHWTSRVLPQAAFAADFSQTPLLRFALDTATKAGDTWTTYQTTDDGATLTQLGRLPEAPRGIAFRDQRYGFAAGLGWGVSTSDGGRTWTPIA